MIPSSRSALFAQTRACNSTSTLLYIPVEYWCPAILIFDALPTERTQVTIAIKKMRTKRRVALTGSPLQNNLVEYYTMVDFVRKGMLGDLQRFKNYFEAPIINGMLIDSSPYDVKVCCSFVKDNNLLLARFFLEAYHQ